MKQIFTLISVLVLITPTASAQYDTLWVGTPESPSTGLVNTPFPTAAAQAARTQYLLRSQDLELAGLPVNTSVVGICFQVVDDDSTDPACLLDIHTDMKNELIQGTDDFVYTGLMPTSTDPEINLTEGVLGIVFHTHWQWLGPGWNALVEVNYERSAGVGLDPRIMLDLDLDYTATFTARTEQNILGQDISSHYPTDVETGSDNSLPAMGLLVQSFSSSVLEHNGAASLVLFPSPSNTTLTLQAPTGTRSFCVTDMCGRIVLQAPLTSTAGQVDISSLPKGCYTLSALLVNGARVSNRFVKN